MIIVSLHRVTALPFSSGGLALRHSGSKAGSYLRRGRPLWIPSARAPLRGRRNQASFSDSTDEGWPDRGLGHGARSGFFSASDPWETGQTGPRAASALGDGRQDQRRSARRMVLSARRSVAQVVAGVAAGVLDQVVLVVLLGRPEVAGRDDLGDDRVLPLAGLVDPRLDLVGGLLLRRAGDRRSPSGTTCRCRCPGGSSSSGRACGRTSRGAARTRSAAGRRSP